MYVAYVPRFYTLVQVVRPEDSPVTPLGLHLPRGHDMTPSVAETNTQTHTTISCDQRENNCQEGWEWEQLCVPAQVLDLGLL